MSVFENKTLLITGGTGSFGNAVGMVRVIGDGGMSFYIKDFAVLPNQQGKGIGKSLLLELENYIFAHINENWAVSLELISSKDAVDFYKNFGFEERPCEWDGPGMFKMLRKWENK